MKRSFNMPKIIALSAAVAFQFLIQAKTEDAGKYLKEKLSFYTFASHYLNAEYLAPQTSTDADEIKDAITLRRRTQELENRSSKGKPQKEKYPSTADLHSIVAGKNYRYHPSLPRINDFGENRPVVISAQGLRGFFTEFDDAARFMNEVLADFKSSADIRCELGGIVFFKVVVEKHVLVAFMNTEENLARVAETFQIKRGNPQLLELSKELPKYDERKHVAVSQRALEKWFNNAEHAAQVINKALGDFMASTDTSRDIGGITFFKAMRSTNPVIVFLRTEDNIRRVQKKFKLQMTTPDYLDFIRTLPEFDGERYIAISGPGLENIYLNPHNVAEKLNDELSDLRISLKRSEMKYGLEFITMRKKNNRPVRAVLKTPENVIKLAKQANFQLSPVWIKDHPVIKKQAVLDENGERIFYDHKKAIAIIKKELDEFIHSERTKWVYNGIEFAKAGNDPEGTLQFDYEDRLKVAEAFKLILMEDLGNVDDSMIAVSPSGCSALFLPSKGKEVDLLIKGALADFLASPDLTCWRFGILWEKAIEHGSLVISFQNSPENIRIIERKFHTLYHSIREPLLSDTKSIPREGKYRNYVLVTKRQLGRLFFDGKNLYYQMIQAVGAFIYADKSTTFYEDIEFVKLELPENSGHEEENSCPAFNPDDAYKVASHFGAYLFKQLVPYSRKKHTVVSEENISEIFYREKSPDEYCTAEELYAMLKEQMGDFIDSRALRRKRFGVQWFKILKDKKVLPGFESTPENIAKVAYACSLKPVDPKAAKIYNKRVADATLAGMYHLDMPPDTWATEVMNAIGEWKTLKGGLNPFCKRSS